ncbi:glycosyltransferase family 2 protein [Thorsellia kenyensis]|uniref:Glycosyltransferase n=1 Tax=Thorsellia kenyensis TaxID=1549888 RepID=A0ABV6CCS4_9GAMM
MSTNQTEKTVKLSVILIMHNEAHNIEDCLNSVSFADEIIIVDSGSQDDSVKIAEANGAKVIYQPWLGFGPQKNVALSHASHEWVLSIDADERVTPALADEIRDIIQIDNPLVGYNISRLSKFCEKEINYSGWRPDYVLRLFKKSLARFSDDPVHEKVICIGDVGKLKHFLYHISYRKIEDVLKKTNDYSTAGAIKLNKRQKKITFSSAFTHGFWAFVRTYVIQRGFLDGKHGLVLAISNAEVTYYRYLKAWFHQKNLKDKQSLALIVYAKNNPKALNLLFMSLIHQSLFPEEIIIADDGSSESTRLLIEKFNTFFGNRMKHVWHEDKGVRLSAIRNLAVKQSNSDYLLFIDGDCVLPKNFIENHKKLAEKGYVVSGSRILLSKTLTEKLEAQNSILALFSFSQLFLCRMKNQVNRLLPLLTLNLDAKWRKKDPKKWQALRGFTIGVWREDLNKVNGFDKAFEGWGMEDSDFVIRLQHAGVFHKSGRFASHVFHLWHKENDRSHLAENQAKLAELLKGNKIKADKGLDDVNLELSQTIQSVKSSSGKNDD